MRNSKELLRSNLTFILLIFVATFLLAGWRATYNYTNGFDEHSHLSYVQYAHDRAIPANGYPMNTWAKQAFSCHPHAIFGQMTQVKCGDILQGYGYPTGGSNTSQAWPPGYFIAISILMRPFEMFISDPLISARFGNVLLWSIGIACIALQLLDRKIPKPNVIAASLLITALPVSAYFSSFVTPYGFTPLLVAWFLKIFSFQVGRPANEIRAVTVKQLAYISGASIAAMYVIPHFILGIFIFTSAAALAVFNTRRSKSISDFPRILLFALMPVLVTVCSKLVFDFWPRIQNFRAVPYPNDVRAEMGNVDPPDNIYSSARDLIQDRIFVFWPNGINFGYPNSGWLLILVLFWLILIGGTSYLLLISPQIGYRFSIFSTALVTCASIMSVIYAIQLPTPPPSRYGYTAVVLGCLLLADEKLFPSKMRGIKFIVTAVVVTYVLNFFAAPIYTEAGRCYLGEDRIIHCEK